MLLCVTVIRHWRDWLFKNDSQKRWTPKDVGPFDEVLQVMAVQTLIKSGTRLFVIKSYIQEVYHFFSIISFLSKLRTNRFLLPSAIAGNWITCMETIIAVYYPHL
jgi:hypothetical protein